MFMIDLLCLHLILTFVTGFKLTPVPFYIISRDLLSASAGHSCSLQCTEPLESPINVSYTCLFLFLVIESAVWPHLHVLSHRQTATYTIKDTLE